jgi:hypothetical protein
MNMRTVPAGMGTSTTLVISTIAVIGSTDAKASMIFSLRILFIGYPFVSIPGFNEK